MNMPPFLSALATMGGSAGPEPDSLPSLDVPNEMPQPMAMPGQMPDPRPIPDAPRGSGQFGGMDLVRELAPMIMSAVISRKNPRRAAAIQRGFTAGALHAQRERLQADQHAQQVKKLGLDFMRQTAADVMRLKDPIERQRYLEFAHDIGVQQFNLPPQWTQKVPAHSESEDVFATMKGELSAQLTAFDKNPKWKDVAHTPQEAKISFRLKNGQTVPVSKARQLVGQAVYGADGAQAFAPEPPAKEEKGPPTDYSRGLARYAQSIGKTLDTLTTQEELAFKKLYGQADDRGPDATLQAIRELTLQAARDRAANKPPLPPASQRRVDILTRGFDQQPSVKRAATMAEAVNFATGMKDDTTNPADDQALLYAFAKAMDPDSVVREGEYATVQKYAQSWAESFGFNAARIFSNTTFLTPQARKNLKATIRAKFAANKKQYDALRQSYRDRINRITGAGDGDSYLTDYGGGFPEDGESAPAPAAVPGGAPSKATLRFNPVTGKVEPIK